MSAKMRRFSLIFIFAAAALGAAAFGRAAATWIEVRSAEAASARLAAGGEGWARLEADGLLLTLHGAPPTRTAGERAQDLAAAPFAKVRLAMVTNEAPEALTPDIRLSLAVEPGRLTMTGRAANHDFAAAAKAWATARDILWRDLSQVGASDGTPSPFDASSEIFTVAAAPLNGRIEISPGALRIEGLAPDKAGEATIAQSAARLRDEGWRVETAVEAPPDLLGPFRLSATRAEGLIRCSATDARAAAAIAEAAKAALGAGGAPCAIGLGAPDDHWVEAARVSLDAIADLPAARIEMTERAVTLIALAPSKSPLASAAARRLEADLPSRYRLTFLNETSAIGEKAPAPPPAYALQLVRKETGVEIAGPFAEPGAAEALAAFARAALPQLSVAARVKGEAAPAPDGWRPVALAALSSLAVLEVGEARLGAEGLALTGRARDAAALRAALAALAPAEAAGWPVESRIRLSPADIAARQALPGAVCVENLSLHAAEIGFSPARAELTEASAAAIPGIAAIARRCARGRLEIEGHTDSQGSEATNLRLSRERAEAVRDALIAAGVPRARLVAKGYGESRPIADNATEAGRERNRRIAFRLMEAAE